MVLRKIFCLTLGLAAAGQYASAQALGLGLDFEQINQQTGGSSTALTFYAAEEQASLVSPGNPTNVTVTRPNGDVDVLNPFFTQLACYSHTYSTLYAFNQDWGTGTYKFSGDSGSLISNIQNNYSMWAAAPQVTDYFALQNLSPETGGDVTLSKFVQDPGATSSSVVVLIYDMTNPGIICDQTYSSSISSIALTSAMLQPDQQYSINIEYLNVLSLPAAIGFQGADPTITYNEVTDATFSTATPEPASFAILAVGLFGLAIRRRSPKGA